MENRINVAELLKDCPTGMELNCLMYDNLYFKCIREHAIYPIVCYTIDSIGEKEEITFNWYGKYALTDTAKCVIFPKGKTTWEGFVPPCQFKDGDILFVEATYDWIVIYKENEKQDDLYKYVATPNYANHTYIVYDNNPLCYRKDATKIRFATEEEKAKLFKAIKDRGYKWNSKTKTLEILIEPNFKVGDWVTDGVSKCQIYFIDDTQYWYSENCVLGSIESVDKQYHLWTINDAKDGDVLFHSDSASNGIFIFKEILQLGTLQKVICYCDYDSEDGFCLGENHTCCWADSKILRPATEERRNRLFQKMREAGYRWNSETKTLEKLFPYNIGTKVWVKSDKEHKYIHTIVGISHNSFGNLEYEVKEEKTGIIVHYPKELLIPVTKELNFKVGDIIRSKNCPAAGSFIIVGTKEDSYLINIKGHCIKFDDQDNYELVPNKFDINTLKPFDKVLIRDNNSARWDITFYELYDNENKSYPYRTLGGMIYKYCIPYEGNEHLCGKRDDCIDFYKTW